MLRYSPSAQNQVVLRAPSRVSVVEFTVPTVALNCFLGDVKPVVPTVDRRCRPRVANMRTEMEDSANSSVETMCSRDFETCDRTDTENMIGSV